MANNYNRVILLGRLTRDPELRYIPSGMAVSDIGLAVSNRRKNASGEWIEEPVFVDVTLWGRNAEAACEYLTKGSPLLIEGHLRLDTWEGRDGQKQSKLRVTCDYMQLVGPRTGDAEGGAKAPAPALRTAEPNQPAPPPDSYERAPPEPPSDDIPF